MFYLEISLLLYTIIDGAKNYFYTKKKRMNESSFAEHKVVIFTLFITFTKCSNLLKILEIM